MGMEIIKGPVENPYAELLGIRAELVERDHTVFTMEIRPDTCNPYGRVHGGALFSLADTAGGFAARSDGRLYVTENADMRFLRGRREGRLRAEARVVHRGKTITLIRVEIRDGDGVLTATAELGFFCTGEAAGAKG